jgi:hypothetical protein
MDTVNAYLTQLLNEGRHGSDMHVSEFDRLVRQQALGEIYEMLDQLLPGAVYPRCVQ